MKNLLPRIGWVVRTGLRRIGMNGMIGRIGIGRLGLRRIGRIGMTGSGQIGILGAGGAGPGITEITGE